MSLVEKATAQMEQWAKNSAHGYDQQHRWGEYGDFDCSSAVISAWQIAGVPVKSKGATYTGNMRGVFLRCGFVDVTGSVNLSNGSGLKRGDVLLNILHHTAMYCGNGQTVEASINEHGGTTGGSPGDQTGREFLARAYRNYPWDCVLRYTENAPDSEKKATEAKVMVEVQVAQVEKGDTNVFVAMLQAALKFRGYHPTWIDGEFGPKTEEVLKAFQANNGLEADGVCGKNTWSEILND